MSIIKDTLFVNLNGQLHITDFVGNKCNLVAFAPPGEVVETSPGHVMVKRTIDGQTSQSLYNIYKNHCNNTYHVIEYKDAIMYSAIVLDSTVTIAQCGDDLIAEGFDHRVPYTEDDKIEFPHGKPICIEKAHNVILAQFDQGTYAILFDSIDGPGLFYPFVCWVGHKINACDVLPSEQESELHYKHEGDVYQRTSCSRSKRVGNVNDAYSFTDLDITDCIDYNNIIWKKNNALIIYVKGSKKSIPIEPEHLNQTVHVTKIADEIFLEFDLSTEPTRTEGYSFCTRGTIHFTKQALYQLKNGLLSVALMDDWKKGCTNFEPMMLNGTQACVTAIYTRENVALINNNYYHICGKDLVEIEMVLGDSKVFRFSQQQRNNDDDNDNENDDDDDNDNE